MPPIPKRFRPNPSPQEDDWSEENIFIFLQDEQHQIRLHRTAQRRFPLAYLPGYDESSRGTVSIVHVPSGLRICSCVDDEEAKAVADWLIERFGPALCGETPAAVYAKVPTWFVRWSKDCCKQLRYLDPNDYESRGEKR